MQVLGLPNNGLVEIAKLNDLIDWMNENGADYYMMVGNPKYVFELSTLNGKVKVSYKEWIIKGVEGEFYPCAEEIFKKTYEEVVS